MKGRDKCELLNEVRQKIAEKNNIEFTVYECTFEGDCTGTCPKCESEVRYLEAELAKKQARGEKINLEGIFTIEETQPTYIDNPRPTDILLGKPAPPIEIPLGDVALNPSEMFLNLYGPNIEGLFKYLKDNELDEEEEKQLIETYSRMMEYNSEYNLKLYDNILRKLYEIRIETTDEKERRWAEKLVNIGEDLGKFGATDELNKEDI